MSAAFQEMAASGWVTAKSGSGVFVRDIKRGASGDSIQSFVGALMEEALSRGFTIEALRDEFEKVAREAQRATEPRGLLVVHADAEFARILATEIEEAVECAVRWGTAQTADLDGSLVLTTASGAAAVEHLRPERRMLIPLKTIEQVMAGVRQPQAPFLIAIVSRSEWILKWAALLIIALGGSGSDLLLARGPEAWIERGSGGMRPGGRGSAGGEGAARTSRAGGVEAGAGSVSWMKFRVGAQLRFMRRKWVLSALSLVVLPVAGRTVPAGGDWPMYSHDLSGTRYSPLTQINPRTSRS